MPILWNWNQWATATTTQRRKQPQQRLHSNETSWWKRLETQREEAMLCSATWRRSRREESSRGDVALHFSALLKGDVCNRHWQSHSNVNARAISESTKHRNEGRAARHDEDRLGIMHPPHSFTLSVFLTKRRIKNRASVSPALIVGRDSSKNSRGAKSWWTRKQATRKQANHQPRDASTHGNT